MILVILRFHFIGRNKFFYSAKNKIYEYLPFLREIKRGLLSFCFGPLRKRKKTKQKTENKKQQRTKKKQTLIRRYLI